MRVKSARIPKPIEVLKTEDRFSTVALRKNVVNTTEVDSLTGEDVVLFEYDEVKIKIRQRRNLESYLKKNFDGWFENGKQLEELAAEIKVKKAEMNELIKEYKQVDVNNALEGDRNILYEGAAETYIELARIEDALEVSMMGAWEMYEMLDEIMAKLEGAK